MDLAQLTGATSSYARKYALCGLFAIDDSIDSDSTNGEPEAKEKRQKTASKQATNQSNTGSNSNYLGVLLEEIKKQQLINIWAIFTRITLITIKIVSL